MDKTLLIIDDEDNIGNSLKRSLSLAGYNVFTARSAEEGFTILEQNNIPVIICDQLMPHVTGGEFLIKVKTLYPKTIRIIFTAYSEFNTLSDMLETGEIHKIITKPWEEEYLVTCLKSAFELYETTVQQNPTTTPPKADTNFHFNTKYDHSSIMEKISSLNLEKDNPLTDTNTMTAIMITDSMLNIQSVNAIFCMSTGYDSVSIIGKPIQLIELQQDPSIIKSMEKSIKQRGSWQGFIRLCKKSGETFSTFLSVASVVDSKKIIKQYTYTFTVAPPEQSLHSKETQINSSPHP